ncbi:DUF5677 domain-containing protein [Arthrobacter zhaoxinii]|uniref:DUF5677 domain-containing protein n=1 Tax=Arthrobacter zhaoxinii TaxID=2964616 RepID=A0ABY5YQZ4_9MICC|nr:DUF5677 domain-containing protein [Arthrobacter zhaoxinii]UWX97353.1 DUF5677 domain-containing protein [Arthrobacter zhaoxinii]
MLVPPIKAVGDLTQAPWLQDAFPDMLWVCAVISSRGANLGMKIVAEVVDLAQDLSSSADSSLDDAPPSVVITGTLTSFDRVPAERRALFLETLEVSGLYERAFPTELRRALLSYETIPSRWLLEYVSLPESVADSTVQEDILRPVVFDSIHGQSDVATKAKIMVVRAYLYAGKLRLPPQIAQEWFSILAKYPNGITEEERVRIEPSMRATYLTLSGLEGEEQTDSAGGVWARDFWRDNWTMFKCERTTAVDTSPDDMTNDGVMDAHRRWMDELGELHTAALSVSESADPDLYLPDRYEVLTGLVFRQIESVHAMIHSPALWHMDRAAGTTRGLIETRIVFKWILTQDDGIFLRFKEYGRGKLKLYKLHLEELRDSLEEKSEELDTEIDHLTSVVNGDIWEEFQDISIAGNFASVDTRKMAESVGLIDDYRLIFSPASAAVHGEWGPISQYTLVRCANPLHRGHRIPSVTGNRDVSSFSVDFALKLLRNLIGDYRAALGSAGNK